MKRAILTLLFVSLIPFSFAQLSGQARDVLNEAIAFAQQGRAEGVAANADARYWSDAILKGREALNLAPNDPTVLRFLAEIYTETKWHVFAWRAWKDYKATGFALDQQALKDGTTEGATFAYLRYQAGDNASALSLYDEVIKFNPDDPRAYIWTGRILLESGSPLNAIPYWEKAIELDPNKEGHQYFLSIARDQVKYGVQGTDNFYNAIAAYEAGDKETAFNLFRDAASENPNYKEAFVWAGRSSQELGFPEVAQVYWQRALELDPSDSNVSYFLALSREQVRWGVDAVNDFREGVALYEEQGNLTNAKISFSKATQANPNYAEAWAWLGRMDFEQGNYSLAVSAYQRANSLEPSNETYRYFYEESQRRSRG